MKERNWNHWAVVCKLIVAWSSVAFPGVVGQDYTAKACPGGKENSPPVEVTLTCPLGQVVSLGEAVFAKNKYGACTFTDGDCKDKTDAFETCESRHNCTVYFERALSPSCGYATFIGVSYNCHSDAETPPTLVELPKPADNSPELGTVSTSPKTQSDEDSRKQQTQDEDNTGLIVGCVLAVIVTIILLIIAIIMVVRRLVCGLDLSGEEEEKKSSACHVLPCVEVEEKEKRDRLDETSFSRTNGGQDGRGSSKRRWKQKAKGADKNQNLSPRLAPVGQEDDGDDDYGVVFHDQDAAENADDNVVASSDGPASYFVTESAAAAAAFQAKRHSGVEARTMCSSDVTEEEELGPDPQEMKRMRGKKGRKHVKEHLGDGIPDSKVGSHGISKTEAHFDLQPDRQALGNVDAVAMTAGDITTRPQSFSRTQKAFSGKPGNTSVLTSAVTSSKLPRQYDAVSVPNTETFTSC